MKPKKYTKIIWRCSICDWRTDYYQDYCTYYCKTKNGEDIKLIEHIVYNLIELFDDYPDANYYALIGGRDLGKSHQAAKYIVDNWEEKGEKGIWIRRYEKGEFETALDIFKVFDYKTDNKGVYLEGEDVVLNIQHKEKIVKTKTYIVYLYSIFQAQHMRGSQFKQERVTTLVWDEYSPENGKFYPDELIWYKSMIESVFRRRIDFKALVIANNTNKFLPLLIDFKINWDQEITYNWKRKIVSHIINPEDYLEITGGVADFSKGSAYYDYAYKNKNLYLSDLYVEKHKVDMILEYIGIIKLYAHEYFILVKEFLYNDALYWVLEKNDSFYIDGDWDAIDTVTAYHTGKSVNENLNYKFVEMFKKKKILFVEPEVKKLFITHISKYL